MSGLDTRGLMDGALRGFDIADRHFARKDAREARKQGLRMEDERLRMARESHEANLSLREAQAKRAQEQHTYLYGEDGKGGSLREAEDRSRRKDEAQIAAYESRKNLSDYQLAQQKKTQFIKDNAPILQTGWQRWMQGGDADEIFDNDFIKGSAYDPRRYADPEIHRAGEVLEAKLPAMLKGDVDMNDPELKQALGTFYKANLDAAVGQKDLTTGKTIKAARWGGVTFAKDINPELEGDQPGLVLTTEVNYGGDDWVPKPVTERRSTESDDFVKVIPLETAMQDITGQLKLRRQAMASPAFKTLFEKGNKDSQKYQRELTQNHRDAYLELEKERAKAIANQLDPSEETTAAINQQFDEQQATLKSLYYGQDNSHPDPSKRQLAALRLWVGDDRNKAGFLEALRQGGHDVDNVSPEQLDRAYKEQLEKHKAKKEQAVARQIEQRYISR